MLPNDAAKRRCRAYLRCVADASHPAFHDSAAATPIQHKHDGRAAQRDRAVSLRKEHQEEERTRREGLAQGHAREARMADTGDVAVMENDTPTN